MKRSSWFGVVIAGGLLVTACGSGGSTAASTNAAATTATSATVSSSPAVTSKSGSSSAADGSTEVAAAQLDADTQTWFSTFCAGLGDIGQYTSPDTAGQSLDQEQATVVAAYTGISTAATKAAADLQTVTPPTITSGTEIASATVTGFQGLADVYGRGAQTIAALKPSSEADLKTAVESVEDQAKAAAPQSLADLDPGVETAVKQLPECATVLG